MKKKLKKKNSRRKKSQNFKVIIWRRHISEGLEAYGNVPTNEYSSSQCFGEESG